MGKKIFKILISLLLVLNLIACDNSLLTSNGIEKNIVSISNECKKIYDSKNLNFISIKNARDAGGFITKDGKKVKEKIILRSGKLNNLSDEEMIKLKDEYNLKQIIDFRMPYEVSSEPDRKIDGVKNNWIGILDEGVIKKIMAQDADSYKFTGNQKIDLMIAYYKNVGAAENMYNDIVYSDMANEGYKKFFDLILDSDGTILYHCTSGKDRTGFASIFLLSLLGVDRETVLNDFEASNVAFEEDMTNTLKILKNANLDNNSMKGIAGFVGVDKDAAMRVLNSIDIKYGSIELYLINKVGLTEEKINKLKYKFLE